MRNCTRTWLRRCAAVAALGACAIALALVAAAPAAAQSPDPSLSDMVLDCAIHARGGAWVSQALRADGTLRFGIINTSAAPAGANDMVWIAFWNRDKTGGQLLYVSLRSNGPRRWLTLANQAPIVFTRNEWTLGNWQNSGPPVAAYMRKTNYQPVVQRLHDSPSSSIPMTGVRRTRAVCDSLLPSSPR